MLSTAWIVASVIILVSNVLASIIFYTWNKFCCFRCRIWALFLLVVGLLVAVVVNPLTLNDKDFENHMAGIKLFFMNICFIAATFINHEFWLVVFITVPREYNKMIKRRCPIPPEVEMTTFKIEQLPQQELLLQLEVLEEQRNSSLAHNITIM